MLTLGVAGGFGHDSAACLLLDGRVVSYAEEERLTRSKLAYGVPPVNAVLACCARAQVRLDQIEEVAFSWDYALDVELLVMRRIHDELLESPLLRRLKPKEVKRYPHHACHAAMALVGAQDRPDAVLVMDGRGESASASIYRARSSELELVTSVDVVDSIGSFYSAASRFAGFGRGGEGKLMGLAAYCDSSGDSPLDAFALHRDGISATPRMLRDGRGPTTRHAAVRREWTSFFREIFGDPRSLPGDFDSMHSLPARELCFEPKWALFASRIQAEAERAVHHLATVAFEVTGAERLGVSGGVGLNCAANGSLRAKFGDALSLHGLMGDAGGAIGAAALAQMDHGVSVDRVDSPYLGGHWSDEQICSQLDRLNVKWAKPSNLPRTVAELLARGGIGAWFQGSSEAGPRALGHRSLIAGVQDRGIVNSVNACKLREAWRPFGPSMPSDEASKWFDMERSPFMIEAARAKDGAEEVMPAVVHADLTSRLHIPVPATNYRYRSLLDAMREATGLGVVLNTSFNVGNEPIVETPKDALRTFYGSNLDFLAIGPALIVT